VPQEVALLARGFEQGDLQVRPREGDRQAREARAAAHVDDGAAGLKAAAGNQRERIEEMLDADFLGLVYGGQV